MFEIKIIIEKELNPQISCEKTIQIDDGLFKIGLRKGLIEKQGDIYIFIGDDSDLHAFIPGLNLDLLKI